MKITQPLRRDALGRSWIHKLEFYCRGDGLVAACFKNLFSDNVLLKGHQFGVALALYKIHHLSS